jgi:hypothetical protein
MFFRLWEDHHPEHGDESLKHVGDTIEARERRPQQAGKQISGSVVDGAAEN